MKKNAFTLAEILITLGIIGVVSALTIPTLVQRNTNETHVQQLKKAYADISAAFDSILAENNTANLRDTYLNTDDGNVNNVDRFLKEYFKVSVDCGTTRGMPCFADTYKNINGDTMRIQDLLSGRQYSVLLSDGTAVSMTNNTPWVGVGLVIVQIDVNGSKGPNIIGRDFFSFQYINGISEDVWSSYLGTNRNLALTTCQSVQANYAAGCLKMIQLDGWKMDY